MLLVSAALICTVAFAKVSAWGVHGCRSSDSGGPVDGPGSRRSSYSVWGHGGCCASVSFAFSPRCLLLIIKQARLSQVFSWYV